ncbi:hypothetical protein E4U34_002115 [Claviceps purpurea]|nr:hypothetical protein E4U34_002115 [Claviceps purpurea]KAG6250936.1 hypothetical protein E4U23_001065 [Claviceps purpurea]
MEHTPSPVHRTRRCGVWCGGAESLRFLDHINVEVARHSYHLQPDLFLHLPSDYRDPAISSTCPYPRISSIDNRSISIEPGHYTVPSDASTGRPCHHEQHQVPDTVTHAQARARDAPHITSDAAVDSSATTPAQAYPSTLMSCSVAMAATEKINEPHDRQAHRRRPFSAWVKKLTTFKSSSDGDRPKRQRRPKRGHKLNNPYPQSGHIGENLGNGLGNSGSIRNDSASNGISSHSLTTARTGSITSLERAAHSSVDGIAPTTLGGRSTAGTMSTENLARRSLAPSHGAASSLAGTSRTMGGGMEGRRGGDSTFSSPAPSVRSLTTTLTTIQSMAPGGQTPYVQAPQSSNANTQSIHFSQPFPSAPPASAIPSHLAPANSPTTYTMATANNLLTDNASILTLASSSKRRRRRSMDTDASVRALAPSSLWGGSRESLPLSVLSANIEQGGMSATPGLHGTAPRPAPERNSIYSAAGVAPAMANERNGILAKQGDGASVRSGRLGPGRKDSVNGNLVGPTSPLATPLEEHERKTIAKEDKADGAGKTG